MNMHFNYLPALSSIERAIFLGGIIVCGGITGGIISSLISPLITKKFGNNESTKTFNFRLYLLLVIGLASGVLYSSRHIKF